MCHSFLPLIVTLFAITYANAQFEIYLNVTDENGCGIGQEFRSGSCKRCLPGTYRFLGPSYIPTIEPFKCHTDLDPYFVTIEPSSDGCKPCPAGTYNPFFGAQTANRCRPCPHGMTSHPGSRNCWSCGRNKSSAPGSPYCVQCSRGYFMTAPCGKRKPSHPCTRCPIGSYASGLNSVQCTKCPEGMSTRRCGAKSQKMCQPCGTRGVKCSCREYGELVVSSYRSIGSSVCTPCPAGTRALTPYATKPEHCKPCPNGTAFRSQLGCLPCSKGEKSFGSGASSCRKKWTDPCPAHYFKDGRGVCKLCGTGYIWNKKKKECQRCPAGSTSNGYTSTQCEKCVFPNVAAPNEGSCVCGPGHFKDYEDTYECVKCPSGTKKEKRFHQDYQCDLDCENFPDQPACKMCPVDYGRLEERGECVKCNAGLRSLIGENRCVNPQTGCKSNTSLVVLPGKYGYTLDCDEETSYW